MRTGWLIFLIFSGLASLPAFAEEPLRTPRAPIFRSGFDSVPSVGGPNSTNAALRLHDAQTQDYYRSRILRDALDPYYAFKRRLNERYGVAVGLDYNVLYQVATASKAEDQAAGGVFRVYANWTFLGRGRSTNSHLVVRVENRHRLGTTLAPTGLGGAIGSLFGTATSFDGWGWGVTNFQWQQVFMDGRYAIAIGQVDARDWIDVFPLSNWRTALLSPAIMYPVTRLPPAGLGGAGQAFFRERNTPYMMAGIFDANGHPDQWGGETFFGDREYYKVVSAGWTPFLRGGYAEGGVVSAKGAAVLGVGYHLCNHDLAGAAIGWGTPWKDGLRDQVTLEVFYRFQLSQNFHFSPDVQILIEPSENPDEDVIGVFGIRAQLVL